MTVRSPIGATCKRLTWANWPLSIDTDDDDPNRWPTLKAFGKRTGISVDWTLFSYSYGERTCSAVLLPWSSFPLAGRLVELNE